MTRDEFSEAVGALDNFGKNAEAALKEFQAEHTPERDTYPDTEVERWVSVKKQARQRFTKSEVEEIRVQAMQEVRDKRAYSARILEAALELAENKAAAVEAYAEVLKPEWLEINDGHFSKAMFRLGDEFAVQAIRQRIDGASWRTVKRLYDEAVTHRDLIAQRTIEGTLGPHAFPVSTSRPDLPDIAALFNLVQAVKVERRRRHPAAAVTLRAKVAAVRNDPMVRRHRQIQVIDGGRSRMVA